ncbi:uncharacterized protein LOC108194890 [Daucus carota subsp. sativus]|uniref:uncharacterized protein LOC108194890 n=1 Tax=Daucus carota subsp. sativus TaxID=79200 RepID=UPI0007EFB623|nr:PREDICTED: uncharacterized protein LOC108194890 [Daucus carota subsp. sativus]
MGCFLTCFGYSSNRRKRRKSSIRILCEDHSLQPEVITSTIRQDPLKDKPKDSLSSKVRKKVSFNLNVKMYEPIPDDEMADCFSVYNKIERQEQSGEVMDKSRKSSSKLGCEGNLMGSEMVLYPADYRYQNLSGSYDEEDEISLEESDLGDEDEDDYDGDSDEEDSWESKDNEDDVWRTNEFEFIEQFYPRKDNVTRTSLSAERNDNRSEELLNFKRNCSARDRSHYVLPVLNPVADLSQWKVVKAKSVPSSTYLKENMPCQEQQRRLNLMPSCNQLLSGCISNSNTSKPLEQDGEVVSSLSNWL